MENVEVDVIPMIYSKEELNNLINIENPKKIKEKFFASFIAKELPPSEDEKKHKIPEGLNDKERGGFCLKLENFPFNFRDNMIYKPLLKQKKEYLGNYYSQTYIFYDYYNLYYYCHILSKNFL